MEHAIGCAARVPIFQHLPAVAVNALGEAMHHRHFHKGEMVMAAGSTLDYLLVLAAGQLKQVWTSGSGREQVVRVLGPGDFLGELAIFAPHQLEGDLIAVEASSACMIPRQAVQAVLASHPEAALALVQALAQRLAQAEELIAHLGLRDVAQRLAAILYQLAGRKPEEVIAGTEVPEGPEMIQVPVPWSEMAVRLGTTPESLSRRLKAFADQGLIKQGRGRKITILDWERLAKLAQG